MSRRESRAFTGPRQNDALFEYEALKKKFLHANKAITRLNSTLSIRIEELNMEISTLYVENLRLRASEIALAAQLKREREKSRKLMADTEAATLNLTRHLEHLRKSYNIDMSPPPPPTPPSPKARRPPPPVNSDAISPPFGRLSRPPNVPGIHEEEEPVAPTLSAEPVNRIAPVHTSTHSKRSASSRSRLERPDSPPMHNNPSTIVQRRKPSRKQSSLLNTDNEASSIPRPSSPAFGSPIRRAAALAQQQDDNADDLDIMNERNLVHEIKARKKIEPKLKERSTLEEDRAALGSNGSRPSRERKRPREDDKHEDEAKSKTNSRAALQPIDNMNHEQSDPDTKAPRTFLVLSPPGATPATAVLSIPVNNGIEGELHVTGRERRVRKSINYAEPKLNTKMRKPDPLPGSEPTARKKRSSASAIMSTAAYQRPYPEPEGRSDTEIGPTSERSPLAINENHDDPLGPAAPSVIALVKKKKSHPRLPSDDESESDGADADEEYIPPGRTNWVNMEARKRSSGSKRLMMTAHDDTANGTRRHSMAV